MRSAIDDVSIMLNQSESLVRIIDHDLVVAKEIITHDSIQSGARLRRSARTEEIGDHHRHIIDLCTADHE